MGFLSWFGLLEVPDEDYFKGIPGAKSNSGAGVQIVASRKESQRSFGSRVTRLLFEMVNLK